MDISEILQFLRSQQYDNNLPNGGPPQPRRTPVHMPTKGDIEARRAAEAAGGALEPDIHVYNPPAEDSPERPYMGQGALGQARMNRARAAADEARQPFGYPGQETVGRLQRRFAGTTLGSPEFFARLTGEDRSTITHPEEGEPGHMPTSYENTELRRGAPPPAPHSLAGPAHSELSRGGGALPPDRNPEGIGHTMGDRRRLSDQQQLDVLRAQLTDPDRDPRSDAELNRAIASLERRMGAAPAGDGLKRVQATHGTPSAVITTDPWEGSAAESSMQNAVRGALGAEDDATMPAPAAAPRRTSLADRYATAIAKIPAAGKGELSEDQKNHAQMDFYLGLLANNKPGSRFLQNAGQTGLAVSRGVRDTRARNQAQASATRREALDEAFRAIGFAGKDEDDAQGQERIGLLREQIQQGKYKVEKSKDGLVLVDQRTGQAKLVKGEDGKPLMPTSANPNIDFYRWLMEDPKRSEFFLQGKNREKNDSDQIVDAATRLLSADLAMGGRMTADQALEHARRVVLGAKGQPAPAPANQKPDPAANKGRTISGPDGRFRSDGQRWLRIP